MALLAPRAYVVFLAPVTPGSRARPRAGKAMHINPRPRAPRHGGQGVTDHRLDPMMFLILGAGIAVLLLVRHAVYRRWPLYASTRREEAVGLALRSVPIMGIPCLLILAMTWGLGLGIFAP